MAPSKRCKVIGVDSGHGFNVGCIVLILHVFPLDWYWARNDEDVCWCIHARDLELIEPKIDDSIADVLPDSILDIIDKV